MSFLPVSRLKTPKMPRSLEDETGLNNGNGHGVQARNSTMNSRDSGGDSGDGGDSGGDSGGSVESDISKQAMTLIKREVVVSRP